ncbi:MAG: ACT domain-containing protein [Kofleriaceae bacterium]
MALRSRGTRPRSPSRICPTPRAWPALFAPLADGGISVDMIVQNQAWDGTTDLTFTLPAGDQRRAVDILKAEVPELVGADAERITADDQVCKVSVVGVGMRSHAGVAKRMFQLLGAENINIQLITTSEIKISVVIARKYGELAVRVLHAGFGLDRPPAERVSLIALRWGAGRGPPARRGRARGPATAAPARGRSAYSVPHEVGGVGRREEHDERRPVPERRGVEAGLDQLAMSYLGGVRRDPPGDERPARVLELGQRRRAREHRAAQDHQGVVDLLIASERARS